MDKILRKYNIQDRVVAVISDNVNNNNALIKAIKKNYGINLIQSFCLAYIIQLNLNAIFAQMKAEPKNSQIEDSILSTDNYIGSETKISIILKKISSCFLAEKYLAFNDLALLMFMQRVFSKVAVHKQQSLRSLPAIVYACLRYMYPVEFNLFDALFYRYTKAISILKDITIYYIFCLYNKLFEYIEISINNKLSQYYQIIAESDLEYLYAHNTILASQNKLYYFKEYPDWQNHLYHLEYISSLPVLGIYICPRQFWKDYQMQYPILSAVAQDILSISANGAGVEQLFNSCCDICHYCRGSLNPSTICEQMLYLCATRLDIDRQKLIFTKDFDNTDDIIDLVDEANILELDGEDINYISNDEQSNDDQLVDISDLYLRSLDTDYYNIQSLSQSSGCASKRLYQNNNIDED
ncbi:hypothetical protein N7450_005413 [Penicillium hetheringtonii]|uniref:HAT C-terminal dimerisation domain-containing protein n=1 Tax=Penicillium hetheringtonii TaxID=911720 RepID=A0AAD6DS77_9EURO|nr:hypothetical protein N7450_005413 [Penicillium hetheringtonii]